MTMGTTYVASLATPTLPTESLSHRLVEHLDSVADRMPEVMELPAWIDPSFLRAAVVVAIAEPIRAVHRAMAPCTSGRKERVRIRVRIRARTGQGPGAAA